MPNKKVTDLTEVTTPADGDLVYIVDVSDTTDSAAGSSRYVQASNLRGWPRTAAEVSASVTPSALQYPPGDVRRYGATGDSVTDDTDALNDALSVSGIITRLSPGDTYLVTGLTAGNSSRISGNGATIKQSVLAANDGSPIVDVTGSNVYIEGVVFDGQQASQTADGFSDSFNDGAGGTGRYYRCAIGIDGTTNSNTGLTVTNCEFKNVFGASVAVENSDDLIVRDNYFHDCLFEGVWFTANIGSADYLEVSGNKFKSIASGDASINANVIITSDAKYVSITGNTAYNFERNFVKVEGGIDVVISNNVINTNSVTNFAAIQLQAGTNQNCDRIVISDNEIYNVGAGISCNTVDITSLKITGNLIDTVADLDGIFSSADFNHLNISGNTVIDANRHGVRIDTTDASKDQGFMRVTGNLLDGVAGAASNYGIVINIDNTYNIDFCDISNNSLSNFRASGGDGWIQATRASGTGVIERAAISGNKCYGAGTASVFQVTGDYFTSGHISGNYFDGDINLNTSTLHFSRDNHFALDSNNTVSGVLTISTGAVTAYSPYHRIATEGGAGTDDLDTINGGKEGDILVLSASSGANTVVLKDGTGNLRLSGDITLDNAEDTAILVKRSTVWLELSNANNGA